MYWLHNVESTIIPKGFWTKKNIVIDLNNTSYLVRIYQDLSLFSIGMQHLLIFVKS